MITENNWGYVSIADAYNVLTNYYDHKTDVQHAALLEALLKVPPAAVRSVVFCKDCIHWKHNPGTNRMYCSVWDWINSSTGEDYCSFAEKRLEKMEGIEQIDLFPELSRLQKWKNKLTAKIIKILKRRR